MKEKKETHLRVVWNREAVRHGVPKAPHWQMNFPFGSHEKNLITFIVDTTMSGSLLSRALRAIKPHYLLDLRPCPRFDVFGYSRQKAFYEFEHCGAKYVCLTTAEASWEITERVHALILKVNRSQEYLSGPLVVLVENEDVVDQVTHALPKSSTKSGEWSIAIET